MDDLMERLREVHVALDREARVPDRAPKEWLDIRAAGSVLRFVDTAYSEDRLAAKVIAACGSVRGIDARPMGLRAIFTTLARATRNGSALS
jgi:ABC-2 type transport system ATP-binding protein